jgi:hypothetical protein
MKYWTTLVKWKERNEDEYTSVMTKTIILVGIPFTIFGFLIGLAF